MKENWWERPLDDFTKEEWEMLCCGCGRCCLHKLEDEISGELFYTDISCKLFEIKNCRCKSYDDRFSHVPNCLKLKIDDHKTFSLLPDSCAYKIKFFGASLPEWHPLISKDPKTVLEKGISVSSIAVSETELDLEDDDLLMDHVIEMD